MTDSPELTHKAVIIDNNEQLSDYCRRWQQLPYITLDTEFIRTRTFYPRIGLIQLNDGDKSYLIDPLSIDNYEDFKALLINPDVVKIFHSCSEDLEVFHYFLGVLVTPLFDIQIAYAFLQSDASISYQRLVEQITGVELDKSETRSDWLRRPLKPNQITYALQDVEFLPAIYEEIMVRLKEKSYQDWVTEECAQLIVQLQETQQNTDYYLKIKSVWRLRRHELAILKELCNWREEQARQRDLPRSFLFKDHSLWAIARCKPKDLRQLAKMDGVSAMAVKHDGIKILNIVQDAMALAVDDCPPLLPYPLPPRAGKVMKRLKSVVQQKAMELGMSVDMLARKRYLDILLKSGFPDGPYKLPTALNGWRKSVIGDLLLEILNP